MINQSLAENSVREISFKPSKKQYEAWELLTDKITSEIGYGGGAGGGKTVLGCFWIISSCLAYPGSGWLIGRKELVNLKRTTLMTFYNLCNEFGLKPDQDFNYNASSNIITFANDAQIFLLDLSYQPSDPLYTRLGGLELTGAFVDQSEEVPAEAIDIIKTRMGRRKNAEFKLLPKLLETFNPAKTHVYQRYYKPFKERSMLPYRRFIPALPTDNPYLPESYLEQLRRSDKVTVMRLLHGNFEYDDDPSALCSYDAILDLFTNTVPPSEEKYLVADIARFGADRIVLTFWRGLVSYKVKVFRKLAIDETAKAISEDLALEGIPYSHCLVDEDGIGGGVVDLLRGVKGFMANAVPVITKSTGKPDNYANFKAQCGYKLASMVNSHSLSIKWDNDEAKRELVEELEQLKAKDLGQDGKKKLAPKEDIKEILGRSPDLLDTLLMRMAFELQPVVKGGGVKVHRPNYANSNYGAQRRNNVKFNVTKPL